MLIKIVLFYPQVIKRSDANAVAVSEAIQKTVAQLETDYKTDNVKLNIADDTTQFTLVASNAVMKDLFIAIFLCRICNVVFPSQFQKCINRNGFPSRHH